MTWIIEEDTNTDLIKITACTPPASLTDEANTITHLCKHHRALPDWIKEGHVTSSPRHWVGHLVPVKSGGKKWCMWLTYTNHTLRRRFKKRMMMQLKILHLAFKNANINGKCKNKNQNNKHAMIDLFWLEMKLAIRCRELNMPTQQKWNSASPRATFPSILVTACVSAASCTKPAGSNDAFPCLFYFSQSLTALHNCQTWLVSPLALTGSDINFYTEWKRFHIPFRNML